MEDYDYCLVERPRYSEYYADQTRYEITIVHDENNMDYRIVTIVPYA